MSKQPGVMLYFDIRPSLARLTLEEKGLLFEAILDYGQSGCLPSLEGVAGVAWDFIRPRLDRDRERYEAMVQQRIRAAQNRWAKARGGGDADASESMPTATPTSTLTPTSASASASAHNPPLSRDQDFNRRRNTALAALEGYCQGPPGAGWSAPP